MKSMGNVNVSENVEEIQINKNFKYKFYFISDYF